MVKFLFHVKGQNFVFFFYFYSFFFPSEKEGRKKKTGGRKFSGKFISQKMFYTQKIQISIVTAAVLLFLGKLEKAFQCCFGVFCLFRDVFVLFWCLGFWFLGGLFGCFC